MTLCLSGMSPLWRALLVENCTVDYESCRTANIRLYMCLDYGLAETAWFEMILDQKHDSNQ